MPCNRWTPRIWSGWRCRRTCIGRDAEYLQLLERAHQAHLAAGACASGARAAFWLGFRLLFRGEDGQRERVARGAQRLLERQRGDCVERGYLALLMAQQHAVEGEWDAAYAKSAAATAAGERFTDRIWWRRPFTCRGACAWSRAAWARACRCSTRPWSA